MQIWGNSSISPAATTTREERMMFDENEVVIYDSTNIYLQQCRHYTEDSEYKDQNT